jgi:hypothetical protein
MWKVREKLISIGLRIMDERLIVGRKHRSLLTNRDKNVMGI